MESIYRKMALAIAYSSFITLGVCVNTSSYAQMSLDEKLAAVDLLKNYDKEKRDSQLIDQNQSFAEDDNAIASEGVNMADTALLAQSSPANKVEPFTCDTSIADSCELQEMAYNLKHRPKTEFVSGNKYLVKLFFTNDNAFPHKYVRRASFTDLSTEESDHLKLSVYEYYLGENYISLTPTLLNVDEVVGIEIAINSVDELEKIASNSKLLWIFHIANSESPETPV